jgi:hypothetical protein
MAQQDGLKLHIRIHSRYQIFDQSGRLPFSIVFGLCRRSPQDTDTRSLILDTSGSIFDVPYALANGLLKLSEGQEETEVDLSSFDAEAGPHQYVALPPPVRRAAHWNEDFEIVLYEIDSKSDLAPLLKPNTKYLIRLGNRDLGVQWWSYGEPGELPPGVILSSENVSEATKLVNSKESAGKAAFTTRDSLPSPPDLDIQLRLRPQLPSSIITDEDSSQGSACTLEVSITNTNAEHAVSIQSTGHQYFPIPWGPLQPVRKIDNRERLTSTRSASRSKLAKQNFIIRSRSDDTNSIVHRTTSPACGCLLNEKTDRRPTRSDFTTLLPGKSLLQTFDLADLLISNLKLHDGVYAIELEALGAWWCWGSVDEVFNDGGEAGERMEEEKEKEKIPKEEYQGLRPPAWLRSKDEVVVVIIDRRILCE